MILTKEVFKNFLKYSGAYLFKELCIERCMEENLAGLESIFNQIFKDIDVINFEDYIQMLKEVRRELLLDLDAAYEGDPAAKSKEEIIITYPGFIAIMTHRIAHRLYLLNIPMIPRMLSELSHSQTGIDINPGATIGSYFFIDHGTGVVIGETAVIGDNVRIYQGVTIGAKSLRNVDEIRSVKRHPTIKNNVTIYSNASILGGDTVIGNNVIIGSNVFLTKSVPDNKKVILSSKNYIIEDC